MKLKISPINAKFIATLPVFISVCIAAFIIFHFKMTQSAIALVLGIIAGGLVDLDNRLTGRLKNIGYTLIAFTVSTLSVQLTIGQPILFIIVSTIIAFIFTIIGAVGLRYRTIAFGTLAVSVYTMLTYDPDMAWYLNSLMILCGTLLYSTITVLTHLLFPHRPVQENMALAYQALATYLDAKAAFFDPDEVCLSESHQIQLAMANRQVIDAFNQCRSSLFYRMRGQHRHPRTNRMLRYYFAAQDIHERASSNFVQHNEIAQQLKNTDLIFRCQRLMEMQAQACRNIAANLRHDRINVTDERLNRAAMGLEQSLKYHQHISDGINLPALQRLSTNLQNINQQLTHLEDQQNINSDSARIAHSDGNLKEAIQSIHAALTPQSPIFRHAVRMALITLVCGSLVHAFSLYFGYWIMLTAVFVCQPNYSATQTRLRQRILGTLGGVVVGSLLPYFTVMLETKLLVVVITTTLFFFFRTNKYSYSTFFITVQALTGLDIAGFDLSTALPLRMLDTCVGAGLAWLAVSYLWPDWHYLQLNQTGTQAIVGSTQYLRQILRQLQYGNSDDVAYRIARRRSHEHAAALSSTLSDMSGEPEKYGKRLQDGFKLLKANYSLLGYISSLGAYRHAINHQDANMMFEKQYFILAEQLCALLETINQMSQRDFEAQVVEIEEQLENLRQTSQQSEQDRTLWQQLSMISRLLIPVREVLRNE